MRIWYILSHLGMTGNIGLHQLQTGLYQYRHPCLITRTGTLWHWKAQPLPDNIFSAGISSLNTKSLLHMRDLDPWLHHKTFLALEFPPPLGSSVSKELIFPPRDLPVVWSLSHTPHTQCTPLQWYRCNCHWSPNQPFLPWGIWNHQKNHLFHATLIHFPEDLHGPGSSHSPHLTLSHWFPMAWRPPQPLIDPSYRPYWGPWDQYPPSESILSTKKFPPTSPPREPLNLPPDPYNNRITKSYD